MTNCVLQKSGFIEILICSDLFKFFLLYHCKFYLLAVQCAALSKCLFMCLRVVKLLFYFFQHHCFQQTLLNRLSEFAIQELDMAVLPLIDCWCTEKPSVSKSTGTFLSSIRGFFVHQPMNHYLLYLDRFYFLYQVLSEWFVYLVDNKPQRTCVSDGNVEKMRDRTQKLLS